MQAFQLEIHADPVALVARGVELWQEWLRLSVADHGYFNVVLAGGSTPKQLYEALAKTSHLSWERVRLFWGDERYVPSDHPDSNYRMVKEALLNHVDIPADQIFPFPTSNSDPRVDAQNYRDQLKSLFQEEWPIFDLILLGVGTDGHTASLFPATAALTVQDQWTAVGNKDGEPRLTLTIPVLNQARQVVFLVTGASKASIVQEILTSDPHLPAQQIQPVGRLLWFLDAAAASSLPLKGLIGN
jgi:6-phosphogluconolactonase